MSEIYQKSLPSAIRIVNQRWKRIKYYLKTCTSQIITLAKNLSFGDHLSKPPGFCKALHHYIIPTDQYHENSTSYYFH